MTIQWLQKVFGGKTVDDTTRTQIAQLAQELGECKHDLQVLKDEFLDVPSLPPLRFLEDPLADRLGAARDEMQEFLAKNRIDDDADISDVEQRYLLMQMFFRGPMAHVHEQLAYILDNIVVPDETRTRPVVDIGCGRGELLQLLGAKGFRSVGIDTSQLMIARLNEQGLEARHGDAVEQLEAFPDDGLCGVCAFHLIEHVQPDYLHRMLRVAYDKITHGGFLLLETPNPFCFEALSFFYTDDTHVRPIQPYQLAFLVENSGFTDVRAHFSAPVPAGRRLEVENWMRRYQNHGIVAYKPHLAVEEGQKAA